MSGWSGFESCLLYFFCEIAKALSIAKAFKINKRDHESGQTYKKMSVFIDK